MPVFVNSQTQCPQQDICSTALSGEAVMRWTSWVHEWHQKAVSFSIPKEGKGKASPTLGQQPRKPLSFFLTVRFQFYFEQFWCQQETTWLCWSFISFFFCFQKAYTSPNRAVLCVKNLLKYRFQSSPLIHSSMKLPSHFLQKDLLQMLNLNMKNLGTEISSHGFSGNQTVGHSHWNNYSYSCRPMLG